MKRKNVDKKLVVTKDLRVALIISSLFMFLFCAAVLLLSDVFMSHYAFCLIFPFTIFYAAGRRVLTFPCYLIIDVHFYFWLTVFVSHFSLIWPTSIVFTIYFGKAIFKRKANFEESACLQ